MSWFWPIQYLQYVTRSVFVVGQLKCLSENVFDIATQAVQPKTVLDVVKNVRNAQTRNKAKTTLYNIAMKVNVKLGGINSQISGNGGDTM